jgi:hypothetical protein
MTLCPIALAVGCRKCPVYSVCPLTTTLGDQPRKRPEKSLSRSAPKARTNEPRKR